MPSLLFLFLLSLPPGISFPCSLTTTRTSPILITLNNGKAPLSLPLTLCTNNIKLPITVQTDPIHLKPSLTLPSLSSTPCQNFTAHLLFSSSLSPSATLTLLHSSCSLTLPLIASGVTAVHRSTRTRLTSPNAPPLILHPPRTANAPADIKHIAVSIVLPSGQQLFGNNAAKFVNLLLAPVIPGVQVKLSKSLADGNLLVAVSYDGSAPRERANARVELRVGFSGAYAGFGLVVAGVVPVVLEVKADNVLGNVGGGRVDFFGTRLGGVRRLVLELEDGDRIIEEAGYETGLDFEMVSFELGDIGRGVVGVVKWRIEVVIAEKVWKASDESGWEMRFAFRPMLGGLIPGVIGIEGGSVGLWGDFAGVKEIRVGGKVIKELVFAGEREIGVFLRGFRKREGKVELEVVVVGDSGLESEARVLVVDGGRAKVGVTVLGSSYDSRKGFFVLGGGCLKGGDATVVAEVQEGDAMFEFAERTGDMESGKLKEVGNGRNMAIVGKEEGVFGHDDGLREEVLTIRVRVTIGETVAETVIFISRYLRRAWVGVSVMPVGQVMFRGVRATMLEAYVNDIVECEHDDELEMRTEWRVNGKLAKWDGEDRNVQNGIRVGLGNRMILQGSGPVTYQFSVFVTKKGSGSLFAYGFSMGSIPSTEEGKGKLRAILNGGASSVAVSTTTDDGFSLACNILDNVEKEEEGTLSYFWTCVDETSENGECAEELFPSDLKMGQSKFSQFSILPSLGKPSQIVLYTVQVSSLKRESVVLSLSVSFIAGTQPLFPDAILETGTGLVPSVSIYSGQLFNSYDDIILSIRDPVPTSATLDFSLTRGDDGSSTSEELLDHVERNLLIGHRWYWSQDSPSGTFLGFRAGSLPHGSYTLRGAMGETAGQSKGASWTFDVEAKPGIVLTEPPIRIGFVNDTVFHASAVSSTFSDPPSSNQFFFSLRMFRDDPSDSWDESSATAASLQCISTCAGYGVVSFTVPSSGRFVIVVDMYDPTGTRYITSASTSSFINVQAKSTESYPLTRVIQPSSTIYEALKKGDERAFLDCVSKLSSERFFSPIVLAQSMRGLEAISLSPFRNPLQVVRVLSACTDIAQHEQVQNLTAITKLLTVVSNIVGQTPASAQFGSFVIPALARFYGAVTDKLVAIGSGDNKMGPQHDLDTFEDVVSRAGSRAFRDIVLVLASGLECGAKARALVPRNMIDNGLHDDYRVGISCFERQVMSLSPEPLLTDLCTDFSEADMRRYNGKHIISSVERHGIVLNNASPGTISGPIVFTKLLRIEEGTDGLILIEVEDAEAKQLCIRSRVSVFVNRSLVRNDSLFYEERTIQCPNGGKVFIKHLDSELEVSGTMTEQTVDEFGFHMDGRISSFVQTSSAATIRMEVNMTRLRICSQLASLQGQDSALFTIVAFTLGFAILFVIATVSVMLYLTSCFNRLDNFSVPRSAAPSHSLGISVDLTQSTADSSGMNSGENPHLNKWEAEYARISGTEECMRTFDGRSSDQGILAQRQLSRMEEIEEDMDDFVSRGALTAFRRISLTDLGNETPWYGFRSESNGKWPQFSGSSSSSSDYYVPDIYVRSIKDINGDR